VTNDDVAAVVSHEDGDADVVLSGCDGSTFVMTVSFLSGDTHTYVLSGICMLVTGSIARSANLPVFSLLRGRF